MARRDYRTADGTKVPGVTTILNATIPKPALVGWAYKRGKEGLDLYESRDSAADAGTLCHAMIQAHMTGNRPESAVSGQSVDVVSRAETAFLNWLDWAKGVQLEPVAIERELVSEEMTCGGTPDLIARVNGGPLALVDWKSGSGVYLEALVQVAAYRLIWEETHPDQPIRGGFYILRVDKETGDWTFKRFEQLEDAEALFPMLRAAYELQQRLQKRVK